MRAVVITNPTPPHNSSPSVSLGKFVRVLRAAGEDVRVIGARMRVEEASLPEDVPVKSFRYGGKGVLKLFSYVLLQIKLFFSLLFTLHRDDCVYLWIADKMMGAYLAARYRGCETSYFLYGRVTGGRSYKAAERMIRYFVRHADYVCAEAAAVFSMWDIIPEGKRLRVIRLHVPESETVPLPFEEREKQIIFVGRLFPEKSPQEIIRAMVKVHEKHPEYRLLMVGAGILEDSCRELVTSLGAEDYITLTGWLSREEVMEHLSRSRLLIHPSVTEGVPGGVLEAMSMGVPPLASPVGGIPEVMEDGVEGCLLRATDADGLAADVCDILEEGDLPAMSAAAMKKIRDKFSLAAAADIFKKSKDTAITLQNSGNNKKAKKKS